MISGAAGLHAAAINGRFEQVEREVYRKVEEPDRWLFVDKNEHWSVGGTTQKVSRKTRASCVAFQVAKAGGRPPVAGVVQWKVTDGNGNWQTVEVEVLAAYTNAFKLAKTEAVAECLSTAYPQSLADPKHNDLLGSGLLLTEDSPEFIRGVAQVCSPVRLVNHVTSHKGPFAFDTPLAHALLRVKCSSLKTGPSTRSRLWLRPRLAAWTM